jgi:tetratricopeptide (TPR) repeat protein
MSFNEGDYHRAKHLYQEALEKYRRLGDRHNLAVTLNNRGNLAVHEGDLESAAAFFEEALQVARELEGRYLIAHLLSNLGDVARAQGSEGHARMLYAEGLVEARELGLQREFASMLNGVAAMAAAKGAVVSATTLYAIVAGLRRTGGYRMPRKDETRFDVDVDEARCALGREAFAAAWADGEAMSLDQALSFALDALPADVQEAHAIAGSSKLNA